MATGTTFEDFIKFLDYTANKGLMKQTAVAARKAAANKLFQELDDSDRADVLSVDLDDAMKRFHNKVGDNYTPDSVRTYQSRVKSALEDFRAYCENPMGFRPATSTRTRKPNTNSAAHLSEDATQASSATSPSKGPIVNHSISSVDILPIPLRADLIVRVQGLPYDLTEAEANKISTVIRAFVVPE